MSAYKDLTEQKLSLEKELLGPYRLVVGLEIHMHVKTDHGMFCACSTEGVYDAPSNTHTCPVCLGLPGALPVPNEDAIKQTHRLGIAFHCELNKESRFDRKHYFYPDLPKGYQISQYLKPLCGEGYLDLPTGSRVELERIHLEEDTAKSFHEGGKTLIDFNKSGMPLIEMVTKPSIHSAWEAAEFGRQVREIVRYLGVSDADMEKGQMRVEPNISLQTAEMAKNGKLPDYKVEIKNINSFKFMEKAILYEIKRQREILESGEVPLQENRGYDEASGETVPQRSKEEAHDYRYFPEPDIPPMSFDGAYFEDLKKTVKRLPEETKKELIEEKGLSRQEADVLVSEDLVDLLYGVVDLGVVFDEAVNLLVNRPEYREFSAEEFAAKIKEQSNKIEDMAALETVVGEVLAENPQVVAEIESGKDSAKEYLLGQVMRKTKGKADPVIVRRLLTTRFQG
ncbi:Asp-tRNA(Asn)/Glu-tRNA(Gln) amidotransferase subunit GatB [candidate division WWE3 bacterium]|nr:Asp-tRNA(Asn)/Glu-tRNA(Gln) amidotransferase subunit GatB [candidate division WWE3 bacterium]